MIVYWNQTFAPMDAVRVSPDDRGFLFGDGVYEVVRLYQGRSFEMKAHEERLIQSAAQIGIKLEAFDGMTPVLRELLVRNQIPETDGILYYQITRGVAPRKHCFPNPPVPCSHYAYVKPLPVPDLSQRPGAKTILTEDRRWLNGHIKSIALLGGVLAAQEAQEHGASEAILHRDGVVTEGSHTNVFAVIDGMLRTHPANHLILDGITRRVVLQLAQELNLPVLEAPFTVEELERASEIFLTGTTVEIWPVIQLGNVAVGNGTTGPMTTSLQQAFDRQDRLS